MDNKTEVRLLLQQALDLLGGNASDSCIHIWSTVEVLAKNMGMGLILKYPGQKPLEFSLALQMPNKIDAELTILNMGLHMLLTRYRDPGQKVNIHIDSNVLFNILCKLERLTDQDLQEKVEIVMAHIDFLKSGRGCEIVFHSTSEDYSMRRCCELAVQSLSQIN